MENVDFSILKRSFLHIPPGSLTCILGPTGCGKSVLLNMLRTGGGGCTSGGIDIILCDERQGSEPGLGPGSGLGMDRRTPNPNLNAKSVVIGANYPHPNPTNQNNNLNNNQSNNQNNNSKYFLTENELKSRVGFVPQDEVLDRGLTVRELLMYHARARQVVPSVHTSSPTTSSATSQPAASASAGAGAAPTTSSSSSSSHDYRSSIVDRVLSDLSIRHIADTIIGGDLETQV